METEAEVGVMQPQSPGAAGAGGGGKDPPWEPPEGARPCQLLDFGLPASRAAREQISLAVSHQFVGLGYSGPRTLIQGWPGSTWVLSGSVWRAWCWGLGRAGGSPASCGIGQIPRLCHLRPFILSLFLSSSRILRRVPTQAGEQGML